MRPFIGWSATVVITLGRSRMGSSCPLLSSPTGNDPAFPKLTLIAHSHTGGLGASFGSAITESLLPEKAIRLSRNTVPPGSNCYRLRHEKGCLVWKPLILQRTFSQQKAGCVFVNILRTGCRRPPFVAATLSAFTVSQQRWDCDIPTVTLALPLVRFDQSVFLSPSPYYNFKIAFWPVQQIRHLR